MRTKSSISKRIVDLFLRVSAFFRENQLAVLSGVMIGTSYIPFAPWAFPFCFAPLWIYVLRITRSEFHVGAEPEHHEWYYIKKAFAAGWVTQFILSMIGFYWIAGLAHEFGQMPWAVSVVIQLLFASLVHLHIPLSLAIWAWLERKILKFHSRVVSLFVLASISVLVENFWPMIFPWNMAYPLLWAKLPLAQLADLVGFQGLSFGVFLVNAWIVSALIESGFVATKTHQKQNVRRLALNLVALSLSLAILGGIGYWRQGQWENPDQELRVLQVQANIGNLERSYAEHGLGFRDFIAKKYFSLTESGLQQFPDSDLVIWPESAFPDNLDRYLLSLSLPQTLVQFIQKTQKQYLVGAFARDEKIDPRFGERQEYNALFLFDEKAQPQGDGYRKSILLAFGEYLPFGEQFPQLRKLLPFVSNFGRGPGPIVMPMSLKNQQTLIGPQICYEGLYEDFARLQAIQGAEVFMNVTNDSWFGKGFEPRQHLYMTLARAIENRRPLLRNTNTGISTAILADGTVLAKSPLHKEWFDQYRLKYYKNPPKTFYTLYGYLWPYYLFFVLAIMLSFLTIKNRKKN